MHTHRIGLFGASGYAGMELTRLLAGHAGVKVSFLASERHVGVSVADFTGVDGALGRARYVGFEEAQRRGARRGGCGPVSRRRRRSRLELAAELVPLGVKVVDLSGRSGWAMRAYTRKAYGHAAPPEALQAEAVYGLTELSARRGPRA